MAKFEELSPDIKERLLRIKANFYYMNAKKNDDGSMGEIKITPDQFNQMLTDVYLEGYHDH